MPGVEAQWKGRAFFFVKSGCADSGLKLGHTIYIGSVSYSAGIINVIDMS